MMNNKVLTLIALNSLLLVYLAATHAVVFNEQRYHKDFTSYNVYTGRENADIILTNLLQYFRNNQELQEAYYTAEEVSHLHDVKQLVVRGRTLLGFSLFFQFMLVGWFLYTLDTLKQFRRLFLVPGLTILTASALLSFGSANFSSFFSQFHEVFFPQGNYIFAPSTTLITLFPAEFFRGALTSIVLTSVTFGFLLTVVGLLLFVPDWKKIHYKKV